ncbi:MAG: cytochrome c3 family protein [Syntrophotalea acetylenica]|nr:cytochrome c3 family protein [Syntrophotalea acetylenica]
MKRMGLIFCLALSLEGCREAGSQVASAQTEMPLEVTSPQTAVPENEKLRFPHKPHATLMACSTCHRGGNEKAALTREMGHGLCLDCHRQNKKGPVECAGCHSR